MGEPDATKVHSGHVMLDIGDGAGALIIHADPELRGQQVDLSPASNPRKRVHVDIVERRIGARAVFAAVFPSLPAGEYHVWWEAPGACDVTVPDGAVAELDWRALPGLGGPTIVAFRHAIDPALERRSRPAIAPDTLPPRYRNGGAVSSAPMGSAPMRYTDQGQVAWDQMWTAFCDLAMAGGPAHRESRLEAEAAEAARADPEAYERVLAEIDRGLRMVTGLETEPSEQLGWIGLRCDDEAMARWLEHAITLENVAVRREGSVLYLPAGASFALDREIKNVVTVVAKTYHYWSEHLLW